MHHGQKYHRMDTMFLSLYIIEWYIIFICPITGDAQFDHLIKVLYVRFISYKVIVFLLNNFVKSYFEKA